ncbi:hypothetical protein Tco_0964446, partial [Tanacetum coccineum]
MGQMAEDFQERLLGVLPSNTVTDPLVKLNVITSMDGLVVDGSFIPHYDFLVYQEKEQELETITEVVEIASSQSTPRVPPLETPPLRADHFVYRIEIVDFLYDKFPIENNSLSGNPTPSSDLVVEYLSSFPIPFGDSDSLLEETGTLFSQINDYFPEYETFCFNIEEKSSGSTTTHSDYSLPDYDAFYFDDDHIKEKSGGSTTTHSNFSLPEYVSFIFDLSIDPFPPADRSAFSHEEFADELAHIISPPEYDYFYFDLEADPGEFTRVLKENIFDLSTNGLTINELNDSSLLLSDCDSSLSKEFSEIDLLVSFPSGNEDIIFDPGIIIIKGVQSERLYILPLDDFSTTSFVSDSLLLTDPSEIDTFLSFPSGNEDKVFDPEILLIDGIFSFTRKFPHLLSDNFMIDKCHILSEISLKIISSVSFHPKDKEIRGETPFDLEDLRACFQSFNHAVSDHLHIPSGESKVHVKVLSVLWGNRLPIPDGLLPLS